MTAPQTPRILIARMGAIGDTILTLPVACALRAHFPNAFLAWVVEEKSSAMVLGHACLDAVLCMANSVIVRPAASVQMVIVRNAVAASSPEGDSAFEPFSPRPAAWDDVLPHGLRPLSHFRQH